MRIYIAPPEHYVWIARRAMLTVGPDFRAFEVADDSGRIMGMVGFDGWTQNACAMSIALETPMALRHLLRPSFHLPFVQLGFGLVTATVLSINKKSLELTRHVGFREVYRIRDGFKPGIDFVLHEMRRADCRWIPQPAAAREAA